jgi:hypothetical protein
VIALLADVAGWIGAGCLLVAYALVSAGRLPVGLSYHLLNLAGAVGLAVNGAVHRAWPSAALNLVWLGIGAAALSRRERPPPARPTPRRSCEYQA